MRSRSKMGYIADYAGTLFAITHWSRAITDDGEPWIRVVEGNDRKNLNHQFRLKDDDGIVYAYGLAHRVSFAPLDYYEGDYGCTEIEFFNPKTNKWEVL